MSEIVKSVHLIEQGSWADALADALMEASKAAGDAFVDARSYCEKWDFITAVGLIVDGDNPNDKSSWVVGLFSDPVPQVGDKV